MLRVTINNPDQKRTLRPLYAQHQATPYGGFLDPNWNRATDIYPGMVMARTTTEQFTLFTGATNQRPYGLSALFVAPQLGIDEVISLNNNLFAVWIGASDATFEVLAPAFDTSAAWTNPTDGSAVPLFTTKQAHAQGPGKITIGTGANIDTVRIGTLIDYTGPTKIVISLDRLA